MALSPTTIRRTGVAGGLAMRDGLSNVISGVGTASDKRVYDRFTFTAPVTQAEVEAAYRTSWLGRKIHDLPPFDETREWRDWQADGAEIEQLEAEERRLGLRAKVQEARRWARLYGGGAIILGAPQGDPALPLNLAAVKKGGLRYLHAVTRYQLVIPEIETDPESEFFGQPRFYELASATKGQVRIHPSRIVPFVGQAIPKGTLGVTGQDAFWGDPLLQSLREAVSNADLAQSIVASLLHEAKVDTLKIPDLSASLATAEYEQRLIGRLNVANLAKSVLNTRILDAGEEWDVRETNFTGLPEVVDKFLQIVAAAADIPVTRLLGTSAKGLNATGEGDNDNYDEMISARQETELRPLVERIDEALIRSALGARPPEVHFSWAPLVKPDPKGEAELQHKKAETAQIYINTGMVPLPVMAAVVQNLLVEDGVYPGMEGALDDFGPDAAVGLPIELFKALLAAWQGGAVPKEALFERLHSAGMLPTGMATFEAFSAALDEEGEALGLAGEGDLDELEEPELDEPEPGTTGRPPAQRLAANDAKQRTLYVYREVKNGAAIIAWAKSQGFTTTLPADKLHVTEAFSRAPVDWMKVEETFGADRDGELVIAAGGPRVVEPLGDKGAIVLMFNSWQLVHRHGVIRQAGADWKWGDEYQPHIAFTFVNPDGLDLEKVEPYRGEIVLGPEIFSEVIDDWEKTFQEVA